MLFSNELKDKYIDYMKRVHHVVLTVEEANEHLESLSGLYVAFSGVERPPAARHLGACDGGA